MVGKILWILMPAIFIGSASEIRVSCAGCDAGKEKVRCDYYVVDRGEKSRRKHCLNYAKYVDIDGAYPKAAWYYLLAGKPQKAVGSARKGIAQGQEYARAYLAMALWILGKPREAENEWNGLGNLRKKFGGFLRERELLKRLYPDVDFQKFESGD
jgi:hypothetical protein